MVVDVKLLALFDDVNSAGAEGLASRFRVYPLAQGVGPDVAAYKTWMAEIRMPADNSRG
jgi:hypothetical protein